MGISERGKRGKGNPHGVRKERRWEPLKWKVEHEFVVMMHVSGKSNKFIADQMDKSEQWVGLVINCTKAKEVIEGIRLSLPRKSLEDKYKYILEKSTDRVIELLENENIAINAPLAMADRALRAIGQLDMSLNKRFDGSENPAITNNTLVLASADTVNKLLTAMERSNKVTDMHRIGAVSGTDG